MQLQRLEFLHIIGLLGRAHSEVVGGILRELATNMGRLGLGLEEVEQREGNSID